MSSHTVKQTYTKALEQVINHVRRTLTDTAHHITMPPRVARLFTSPASERVVAEELLRAVITQAYKAPPPKTIAISFNDSASKTYTEDERRIVTEWANKGLEQARRVQMVKRFTHIGVRKDIANNMVDAVTKQPNALRTVAQLPSHDAAAGH
jgi:hypothetical protein